VIDPSILSGPATIRDWSTRQKRPGSSFEPYVTVTRLGEAPIDPHGHRLPGSGYWTGPDPREGLDAHAARMMRLYKLWQGKIPPRTLASTSEPATAESGTERSWVSGREQLRQGGGPVSGLFVHFSGFSGLASRKSRGISSKLLQTIG
jgi:hypothetical protein